MILKQKYSRSGLVIAVLAGAAVMAAAIPASATLFAGDNIDGLWTVNTTTGAATFVGFNGVGGFGTEIEYGNGALYSQATNGGFLLDTLNPATGASLGPVLPTPGAYNGMEFVGGVLYATEITGPGGPSNLVTVNTATGASTLIGATGFGPISGLAYDTIGGVMYGVTAGGGPADLVTVNLLTGSATVLAPIMDANQNIATHIGSIEFESGTLYAGFGGSASGAYAAGDLYSINLTSGLATFVGNTGIVSGITGLTSISQSVPEAATLGLFGLGLAGLGIAARRRKAA